MLASYGQHGRCFRGSLTGTFIFRLNSSDEVETLWRRSWWNLGWGTTYPPAVELARRFLIQTPKRLLGRGSEAKARAETPRVPITNTIWLMALLHKTKISDGAVHTSKIADNAVTAAKIPNQGIGHVKIGSTVAGVDQAAGRILEADGAGDVRWGDKGGGTSAEADSADRLLNEALGDPTTEEPYTLKTYFADVFIVVPRTYDTTATFTEFARYSDVSALWNEQAGTYRWRGVHASSSRLQNEQTGDVFITHSGKFFHINSSGNFAHLGHPDGWRGQWNDEADALHHITDDNEVVQYGESLWLTSAYVAGTTTQEWADYDPGVHVYMPSDQLLHEQTLVEKMQGVLRDVKKVDSRFGIAPVNAGFAVFEEDPTTSELEAGTYGTALHTYDDTDDTYQHIVWEIPIDEDVLDFWQEITIDNVIRLDRRCVDAVGSYYYNQQILQI